MIRALVCLPLLLAATATVLAGQSTAGAPDSPARVRAAAREVMSAARYASFVTLDAAGQPQARVVDPLLGSGDTIWIATNPLTRKVAEVARNPRVTLLFFDPARSEYVTVIGRASIVTDSAQRAMHWKAEWTPFYPDRGRGREFVLIAVRATRLEVVSPRNGLSNDPRTWRPVILEIPF